MSTTKNKLAANHKYFMNLAFKQASKILGNTAENPAVGCVVVKKNSVISLGHTSFNGRPHAEKVALSENKINFSGSSLYSTLEPCSHKGKTLPCIDIIKKKKIKNVFFSQYDSDERSYKKAKKNLKKNKINTIENICKKKGHLFYKDYFIKKKKRGCFYFYKTGHI